MTREESFKEQLIKLLDEYHASIIFNFNPPDMKMLECCNGFKICFELEEDKFKFVGLTDKNAFAIDVDNIIKN